MEQKAQSKDFKHIVRIANTDLDGTKSIYLALTKIKGVSFMFSNLALHKTSIDKRKITGELSDSEIKKLDEFVMHPHGIPAWMMNRRGDYETGEDKHLTSGDIDFNLDNDLKRLKMIRAYKGIRHMLGLPARGQRTKSNFRKNKGNVLGVKRKAASKK
jgi:small subunit ribosomal protein S13